MSREAKDKFLSGYGSRKSARASVWLYEKVKSPVKGIIVNEKESPDYFGGLPLLEPRLFHPFQVCNLLGKFGVSAKVKGGGKKSQLEAVILGIAKALVKKDPELKPLLRREGLLTRDSRMVESKKWGRHKARRGHQFSKR